MARRKYEFKPDRSRTSILHKLYLTKKQRQSILKWLLYSLVLLTLGVFQDVILCRLWMAGISTDLVPCAILLICILQDTESGSVFTLLASLFYLFSGTAPGVYSVVFLTFLGVGANIFRQSFLRKGFSAAMLCTAVSTVLYELAIFVTGLLLGRTVPIRVLAFCLTGALSLLSAPVLYPVLLSIGKIGGETWKE